MLINKLLFISQVCLWKTSLWRYNFR